MNSLDSTNLPVENRDFMMIPHPTDDKHYGIRIKDGPYMGVEYSYNTVSATERGDNMCLHFDYSVLKSPEDIITSTEDFERWAADILHSILLNAVEDEVQLKDQDGNTIRAGDPEAPGAIGRVHKDNDSVS